MLSVLSALCSIALCSLLYTALLLLLISLSIVLLLDYLLCSVYTVCSVLCLLLSAAVCCVSLHTSTLYTDLYFRILILIFCVPVDFCINTGFLILILIFFVLSILKLN